MAEDRSRIPYRFTPVPHAVPDALAAAQINQTELSVLVALYRRADRRFQVRLTLAQLVVRLAWTKSEDWLSKILRGLRTKGWLSYEAVPGKREQVYVFTLRHAPNKESEQAPEQRAERAPRLAVPSREVGPRAGQRSVSDDSETEQGASGQAYPRLHLLGPRPRPEEVAANGDRYWEEALERVRAIENDREKAKAACDEGAFSSGSLTKRTRGPKGQRRMSTPRQAALFTDSTDERKE